MKFAVGTRGSAMLIRRPGIYLIRHAARVFQAADTKSRAIVDFAADIPIKVCRSNGVTGAGTKMCMWRAG